MTCPVEHMNTWWVAIPPMLQNPVPATLAMPLNHRMWTYMWAQYLAAPTIQTTIYVPGPPVVDMHYMKPRMSSRSRATISPGAAIAPTSWTRALRGSGEVVARTMAPAQGCSTLTAAMASRSTTSGSEWLCCCNSYVQDVKSVYMAIPRYATIPPHKPED